MTEAIMGQWIAAISGLVGVLIGSLITVAKDVWAHFAGQRRTARYLAIRVVCILDKYVEKCAEVVVDDGLCFGQRDANGYLVPQVKAPDAPAFPVDVDWKSIDPDVMYDLLSLPNEAESANAAIRFAWDIACPPDHDEVFEAQIEHYSGLGLKAAGLAARLRKDYGISAIKYGDWNPIDRMKEEKEKLNTQRAAAKERMASRVRGEAV